MYIPPDANLGQSESVLYNICEIENDSQDAVMKVPWYSNDCDKKNMHSYIKYMMVS